MKTRGYWIGGGLIVMGAAAVVLLAWHLHWRRHSRHLLRSLLEGSEQVQIRRIDIDGQGRSVSCSDAASLEFLACALRQAKPVLTTGGTAIFGARIFFVGGGYFDTRISPYADGNAIQLAVLWSQLDADEQDYLVQFSEPAPPELMRILQYLLDARKGQGQGKWG